MDLLNLSKIQEQWDALKSGLANMGKKKVKVKFGEEELESGSVAEATAAGEQGAQDTSSGNLGKMITKLKEWRQAKAQRIEADLTSRGMLQSSEYTQKIEELDAEYHEKLVGVRNTIRSVGKEQYATGEDIKAGEKELFNLGRLKQAAQELKTTPKNKDKLMQWYNRWHDLFGTPESPYYNQGQRILSTLNPTQEGK